MISRVFLSMFTLISNRQFRIVIDDYTIRSARLRRQSVCSSSQRHRPRTRHLVRTQPTIWPPRSQFLIRCLEGYWMRRPPPANLRMPLTYLGQSREPSSNCLLIRPIRPERQSSISTVSDINGFLFHSSVSIFRLRILGCESAVVIPHDGVLCLLTNRPGSTKVTLDFDLPSSLVTGTGEPISIQLAAITSGQLEFSNLPAGKRILGRRHNRRT